MCFSTKIIFSITYLELFKTKCYQFLRKAFILYIVKAFKTVIWVVVKPQLILSMKEIHIFISKLIL